VLDEAESYEPAMVAEPVLDSFEPEAPSPEPISESFEPEVVPEPIELVNETEAVLAAEPEPVEAEWPAESVSPPEPAAVSQPQPEAEPEPAPELEPVAEPASEGETAPAEPELVVTETMAEIFLRQGHRELALAVYSQLALRDPMNERVAAAAERLRAELAPPAPPEPEAPPAEAPRRYAAATTGGRSVAQRFAELLAAVRPPVAAQVHPPTFEASRRPLGDVTRPAPESLSLSSVFGEEAAPAGPAGGPAPATPAEPSFEQFFAPPEGPSAEAELPRGPEQEAPALSSMAPEDLEQFNAWLRGLKR
jgi:hypothetical protein